MTSDKVLNARVSKKLYEKISSKAKKNRTSISNLIRNLVEDALELHDDFHEAVDKKIRKYLSTDEKQTILGYQEMTLTKNTECDNCGKVIKASEKAYMAFFEDRDMKAILCESCRSENSHENNTNH